MIKDIEMFMELDSLREELEIMAETYGKVADTAYYEAVMCSEEDDLIAYGVWMDVVEMVNYYLDELYDDIKKIKEQLQELVGEA